jgi:hypothetical protein
MVQTLTVRLNGTAEINTGANLHIHGETALTQELQYKLEAIEAAISDEGASELHVERDTFREFEHMVKAGKVHLRPFGSTVSVEDFDWVMAHVDVEVLAQIAAESEGMGGLGNSQAEPDLL